MTDQPADQSPPRSLAEDLRRRSDDQLQAVIDGQPDLWQTPPADLAGLAAQVSSPSSVAAISQRLDRRQTAVLQAMSAMEEPTSYSRLCEAFGTDSEGDDWLLPTLESLWNLGLVWGDRPEHDKPRLMLTRPARSHFSDDPEFARAAETGSLREHFDPSDPVVAAAGAVDPEHVRRSAADAAFTLVAGVESLLGALTGSGVDELRSGGIGIRELRALAKDLDTTPEQVAAWAHLAAASNLMARHAGRWLPTTARTVWLDLDLAHRWAVLVTAWLTMRNSWVLVGARDVKDTPAAALSEATRFHPTGLRGEMLAILARAPEDEFTTVLAAEEARQASMPGSRPMHLDVPWAEAEVLGLIALGSLSPLGRAVAEAPEPTIELSGLLPPVSEDIAQAATKALPAQVDEILVQTDLTVVVPGPPTRALAERLNDIADVESRGTAMVYRLSAESLRRGLERHDPAEIKSWLATVSVTPIPQPLEYLLDDAARNSSQVLVGVASTYVRGSREVIEALVKDPRASHLELLPLADTVAITTAEPGLVIPVLRDVGLIAHAESQGIKVDGSMLAAVAARPWRAPRPLAGRQPTKPLVSALRAAESTESSDVVAQADSFGQNRSEQRLAPGQIMLAINRALEQSSKIVIAYADNAGASRTYIVAPVKLDAGVFTATDLASKSLRQFAISRIVHAQLLS